jgi:hypothetical protein
MDDPLDMELPFNTPQMRFSDFVSKLDLTPFTYALGRDTGSMIMSPYLFSRGEERWADSMEKSL